MKTVLFSYNASGTHTNLAIRALRSALCELPDAPEVKIYEFTVKDKRDFVLSALYSEKAEIYGFSTYIWNITETLSLAGNLKKLLPEAKIFFGGPEAGCRAEELKESYPFIDTVISGEGEEAVKELIRSYPDLPEIINAPRDPDFLFRRPHYFIKDEDGNYFPEELPAGKLIYYESSRGCPFSCKYCLSGSGAGIRAKTAKETLSDLSMLETLPGGERTVKLIDRTFNYDLERAKEIVSGLSGDGYKNRFHFEIQPALIDSELIGLFGRAPKGRFQLEIGIQSVDEKVLKASGRGGSIKAELENLRALKTKTDVPLHVDLIVGLPKSGLPDVIVSVNTVYYLSTELQLGFLKVLPGTKIKEEAEKYGIVYRSEPPYEVLYTNTLGFSDVFMLKGVAHTLDRVAGSGKFSRGLEYLLGTSEDDPERKTLPFEFFYSLSRSLGSDPTAFSQSKMYEAVFDAGIKYLSSDAEKEIFKNLVKADFLSNERTRVPEKLR